jgi:urease accessory protein
MSVFGTSVAARRAVLVALGLAGGTLLAGPALAHAGHDHVSTFTAGLLHPFGGWDHVAAMAGVGFWAAQQRGRQALWTLPALFIGGVLIGAAAALAGLAAPFVEAGILLGLAVIAALVVFSVRPPLAVAGAGVLALAVWHGMAHGLEAPAGGSVPGYMAGFTLSTAALHAAGAALAALTGRARALSQA